MSTLILKKQKKCLVLPLKLFVYGIRKVKYVLLDFHPDNAVIIYKMSMTILASILLLWKKKKSVIVECLPSNKWMTLSDKKIFLDKNILLIAWLQTSVLGLIGKEKVLKPFWTEQCRETSQKLWLPIEIDCADSPSTFWKGSSTVEESNSWFSTKTKKNPLTQNFPTTFSPSFMSIPVDKWEDDVIRSRKLRLYPTPEQKKIMKEWMGTRRYVYNRVLDKIKQGEKINFFDLRNKYVTAKNNPNVEPWELETPKDIRAGAIRDSVKNYNSAFSLLKNKQISGFKMKFCSKKDSPSIEIPSTAIGSTIMTIERTEKEKIKAKENVGGEKIVSNTKKVKKITKAEGGVFIYKEFIKTKIMMSKRELKKDVIIEGDCRLHIKNNKWYLIVPVKIKTIDSIGRGICALDPGVRTFQTIYSETSVSQVKINKETIKKLQIKIDLFRSLRDKKVIKKKRFTRKERKINFRINNLIDELHFKTIILLTKNFDCIILPSFESQEMAMRINSRSVNRGLLQLKHYMFKERLRSKTQTLRGCTLDVCTEEYTSKTCGRCGVLNDVGLSEVYKCIRCSMVIDRDVNGARNIAIKRLVEKMI